MEIRILIKAGFSFILEIMVPSNCVKRQVENEQLCVCVLSVDSREAGRGLVAQHKTTCYNITLSHQVHRKGVGYSLKHQT